MLQKLFIIITNVMVRVLAESFFSGFLLCCRFHGGSRLSIIPEGGTDKHPEEGRGGDTAAGTGQKHLQGYSEQAL